MALTWFDLVVGGLMIISGLLALMRGFTREITSLFAWGAAALAAFLAVSQPDLVKQVQEYLPQELIAKVALAGGVFLIVLIVLSLISIRLTDWLLDSIPGPFDRTLGFIYGIIRGLALVVIAYLFYIWFIPEGRRFDAVRQAYSLSRVEQFSQKLIDVAIPGEIGEILSSKMYMNSQGPSTSSSATPQGGPAPRENSYNKADQKQIDQLIESTQGRKGNNEQN